MTNYAAALLEDKTAMGPLLPFLADSLTEDVAMQVPGEAWIYQKGRWLREEVPVDLDGMWEIAKLAAAPLRKNIDEDNPLLSTELPGGERLQVCLPPTVDDTIALIARKHDKRIFPTSTIKDRYRTEGWHVWRRRSDTGRDMSKHLALKREADIDGFVTACVQSKFNILQVAPTGVGKTTFGKTICSAIDPSERLITIEEAKELSLVQPNFVRLLISDVADASALLRASLWMRPDRVMVQELRDPATIWTLLSGVVGPHPGFVSTIHGHDPISGLKRAELLIRMAPESHGMDTDDIIALLSDSIDVIIPLEVGEAGERVVFPVWFVGDPDCESIADLLRS